MKTINTNVPSSHRTFPSPAKCKANRENSFKSTGPKTRAGKKNVRFNAVKHSFFAQEMIIRPEDKAENEKLQRILHAQLLPRTALQQLGFEAVCHCAWQCKLAAPLDMRRLNALLFPPDAQESSLDTDGRPAMEYLYTSSPEGLRQGIRFLEYLKLKVESRGEVPEELKDSVRKGFGPRFLDLLDQPKSPINRQALLLADFLTQHEKKYGRPLPPLPKEGPKVIIDPQQSWQALLNIIEVKKEFLNDLRQSRGQEETNRVSAGDSPPRYFADATRALHRAVTWYQYLVANNL